MKQLPANSMPGTSTEDMVAWPGTETAAVVLSLNQTQLCPSLAIGAVQKMRPQYTTLRWLLYCNNRGRMQISRSHQIKPNLLWMHNFDPNRKCDSTWLCGLWDAHFHSLLMVDDGLFCITDACQSDTKEESVNRKSKSCCTQRETVTSLQLKRWGKTHFTELLRILCHTQRLALKLFRSVLKNSSSCFKSKAEALH